jgi:hypothetical protein
MHALKVIAIADSGGKRYSKANMIVNFPNTGNANSIPTQAMDTYPYFSVSCCYITRLMVVSRIQGVLLPGIT